MLHIQSKISQGLIGVLAAIIFGWISYRYLPGISPEKVAVAAVAFAIGLLFLALYRQFFWQGLSLPHFLLSLMIAASFIGSNLFIISAGPVTIFPFRIFLVAVTFVIFGRWLGNAFDWRGHFNIPYVYLFFFFWITFGLLALSWAPELVDGIKDVIFLITGIMVIFLITYIFKKERNYLEFFVIWVVMAFLLIGIGLVNHFLQIHLPGSRIYHGPTYQQGIPTAVFVNENDYASFLGITVFFFVSMIKNGRRMIYQILGLAGSLLSVYLILITESRANYIGVFLAAVFWFIFLLRSRVKIILVFCGAFFIPPLVYLKFDLVKKGFGFLMVQLDSLLTAEQNQHNSVDIRENLLRNIRVFLENTSGLGVGPGNIEYYMKNYPVYETFHNYNPHNWWAEILIHYGFFVLIGYILSLIYLFFTLYRIWKVQVAQGQSLISEALLCALIAFTFASISPNSFMTLNYNWILIAFVVGYTNFHIKKLNARGGPK